MATAPAITIASGIFEKQAARWGETKDGCGESDGRKRLEFFVGDHPSAYPVDPRVPVPAVDAPDQ